MRFSPDSEFRTFDFRLRAVQGGRFSDWVFAQLVRGIRPPTMSGRQEPQGANDLDWVNRSLAANSLLLERAPQANGSLTGAWTQLPAVFGAASHVDADIEENVEYRYRLRFGRDGVQSEPVEWRFPAVPLLAPRDFRATLTAEGTTFNWTNRSARATTLKIGKVPIPVSTTTFFDDAFPWPGTSSGLLLSAVGAYATSNIVTFDSLHVPGRVTALEGKVLAPSPPPFSQLSALTRHPDGTWEITYDGYGCQETRGASAPPSAAGIHCVEGAHEFVSPGVRGDPAGNPHLLFTATDSALFVRTHHEWRDAGGWHAEVLPLDVGGVNTFDVGEAGALHLLAARGNPAGLEYGERATGAWTWTLVPFPSSPFSLSRSTLASASDGSPEVLMQDASGLVAVALRQADGSFATEPVVSAGAAVLVPGAGGRPGAVFLAQGKALYVQRSEGKWLAPEQIVDATPTIYLWAGSGPGERVDALVEVPDATSRSRLELWRRDASGWHGMSIVHGGTMGLAGGYLADGKLWIAAPPDDILMLPNGAWATWREP